MQPRSSIAKSTGFFSLVSIVTGANPQDVAVCFASPIVTICRYPRVFPNHLPQDLATAFPTGNLPVRVCDLFAVLLRVAGFFLRILPGGWWLQPGPAWSSGLIVRLCPCPSPGWLLSFFLVSRFFPATCRAFPGGAKASAIRWYDQRKSFCACSSPGQFPVVRHISR